MIETGTVDGVVSSANFKEILTTRNGKGRELCELLCKELGIPDGVRSFTVTFAVGQAVMVTCEYLPRVSRPNAE